MDTLNFICGEGGVNEGGPCWFFIDFHPSPVLSYDYEPYQRALWVHIIDPMSVECHGKIDLLISTSMMPLTKDGCSHCVAQFEG